MIYLNFDIIYIIMLEFASLFHNQ